MSLESIIETAVQAGIEKAFSKIGFKPEFDKENHFITREEAARILDSSIATISNYTKGDNPKLKDYRKEGERTMKLSYTEVAEVKRLKMKKQFSRGGNNFK